jgi:hypothetical protein
MLGVAITKIEEQFVMLFTIHNIANILDQQRCKFANIVNLNKLHIMCIEPKVNNKSLVVFIFIFIDNN